MTTWSTLPTEQSKTWSPIGLSLVDDLTAGPPTGALGVCLDAARGDGTWMTTEIEGIITPGGVLVFPGLGRTRDTGVAARHYRVRITADFYRPAYLRDVDGWEFDAPPFNNETAPANESLFAQLDLLPASNYPFLPATLVLRGQITDGNGAPAENIEVSEDGHQSVLTDERGEFALPLRNVAKDALLTIDATDHRTWRGGEAAVQLPGDATKPVNITLEPQ